MFPLALLELLGLQSGKDIQELKNFILNVDEEGEIYSDVIFENRNKYDLTDFTQRKV